MPALPQPEPLCRLIQVKKGKTRGSYLLVRTLNLGVQRTYRCGNEHVEELVAVVGHGAVKSLDGCCSRFLGRHAHVNLHLLVYSRQEVDSSVFRIFSFLYDGELEHLASIISTNPSKQNREMQQLVKKNFGISMNIPAEMNASKKAKDFIWISNNASSGMKNLILMKVKSEERRAEKVKSEERRVKNSDAFSPQEKQQIDSILRTNMPGETDSMYMVIPVLSERGLWEMKGDAMGGPYVMRRICPGKGKDEIIIIGFVYAPEMKKKILIKQLEAAISTIKYKR